MKDASILLLSQKLESNAKSIEGMVEAIAGLEKRKKNFEEAIKTLQEHQAQISAAIEKLQTE